MQINVPKNTSPAQSDVTQAPWVIGVSRGDPLTRHLFEALSRGHGPVLALNAELGPWQRYLVALTTFHPSLYRWKEQFFKSFLAFRLHSRNSRRAIEQVKQQYSVLLQVNALFQPGGTPYVLYIDNTQYQSALQWPAWSPFSERGLARWYAHEQKIYQQAEHIFTMGEPTAHTLRTVYSVPADRVTNVGGGVNFKTLPVPTHESREPVILFVGHDFRRKGGKHLLEAFRRVREQIPEARLQIIGTSAVPSEPGVEVLGRIDDRQRVAELYSRASIFCLPAYFEPFGLVLVEAMAYGLPCVGTTVCSIPDIVRHGETGVLVPPFDSVALSEALIHLLKNPAYVEQLGTAGRKLVEEQFTWDHVAKRMAPVLARLSGTAEREEAAVR